MNQSFDFCNWVEAAKKGWLSIPIKIQPGVPRELIATVEAAIGFSFPDDMRALYQVVNGFKDGDWAQGMIFLWPMEQIREEYKMNGDPNFVGFCDFLINSHAVGFHKARPEIYKSYDEFNAIAHTFIQVINMINRNSDDLI
jgi:hypothetical protein